MIITQLELRLAVQVQAKVLKIGRLHSRYGLAFSFGDCIQNFDT